MAMNVAHNIGSLGIEVDILTNDGWEKSKKSRYIDNKTNQMLLRIDENDEVLQPFDAFLLKEENIRNYDAVIISDYCKGFLTEKAMKQISLLNQNVFLDTKRLLGPWCSDIEFIKINYYEHDRTKHLLNQNIYDKLIITLGSDGCKYRDEVFPVPKVEIKDSSGGGDTFIAALVAKYIETKDIRESIRFANECATKVVQKRGVSII